jgi:hypothetical protein
MAGEQGRPFREGILDPALAKIALAGEDQFFDLLRGSALAHGDEPDIRRIAGSKSGCRCDSVENGLASVCGATHEGPL